jgi:hypothetical protein
VLQATGGAYAVQTALAHKDLGEWVKESGADADEIQYAMKDASFEQPAAAANDDDDILGKPRPKLDLQAGADSFATHNGVDQQSSAEPRPLRPMPSWIDYGEMEVDRTQYHIGEGFLEIGGFIVLIGQSYVGKSTLTTQLSINLAIGKSWLFFRIERSLRILVVQAEDPKNKRIKMGQMFKRMGLTSEEIDLVRKNTAVLTIRDLQDQEAINEIERHAVVFKPDIICLNPLTSYLTKAFTKTRPLTGFCVPSLLRCWIGSTPARS